MRIGEMDERRLEESEWEEEEEEEEEERVKWLEEKKRWKTTERPRW